MLKIVDARPLGHQLVSTRGRAGALAGGRYGGSAAGGDVVVVDQLQFDEATDVAPVATRKRRLVPEHHATVADLDLVLVNRTAHVGAEQHDLHILVNARPAEVVQPVHRLAVGLRRYGAGGALPYVLDE